MRNHEEFSAKKRATIIGLIITLIYTICTTFSTLAFCDFFSYESFDLALRDSISILLLFLDNIILIIYFICVLLKLKNMKFIQFMLLTSILIVCGKSLLSGSRFIYTGGYYLDILLWVSYIGIFIYLLNIFNIIKINFANNKFFIVCIFINILPWFIYLFLAQEMTFAAFIFYTVSKISIIPFFYNEYYN